MNSYQYHMGNKTKSMTSIEDPIPMIIQKELLDLSYKLICSKYLTSHLSNCFNYQRDTDYSNLYLNELKIPCKAPNVKVVINEINIEIIGIKLKNDCRKNAVVSRIADLHYQENILNLSIERHILQKLKDIINLNKKKKAISNSMILEYKQLNKTKNNQAAVIINNEALIQSLNNELSEYYKAKNQIKQRKIFIK